MAVSTDQAADITKLNFQVIIGLFFALSIASVLGRIGFRIYARRSLYLDDYLVLMGTMTLSAAVGIAFKKCDFGFLVANLQTNPALLSQASVDQLNELSNAKFSILYAFFNLAWTTIFAVKFAFLAFFNKLIHRVTKIHMYYWVVVIVTLATWLFMLVEPLIVCQNPSENFLECMNPSRHRISIANAWLTNALDVLTDILVISIPMIILRRATLRKRQKLAMSFFLCLSIVMIIITIIRSSRISDARGINTVWQILWQILEGCVALLMASITAFRNIFVSQGTRALGQKRWAPSYSWIQRAKQRKSSKESQEWEGDQLPSIPHATFQKMRLFVCGHHTTQQSDSVESGSPSSGRHEGTTLTTDKGQQNQDSFV